MIIFTDGKLLKVQLIERLAECVSKYNPTEIILREKHLSDVDYQKITYDLMRLVSGKKIVIWVNGRSDISIKNNLPLHIGYKQFIALSSLENFHNLSVSVHSLEEAILAEKLGAKRLVVGHIFTTECKAGLPARGLEFLKEICLTVKVPVVAIGGININNFQSVLDCGASDFCIMSSAMNLTF